MNICDPRERDLYSGECRPFNRTYVCSNRQYYGDWNYYRTEQDKPFYKPVFDHDNKRSFIFVDPMNTMKNRFKIIPTIYKDKSKFLNDTNSFREDLISIQMTKMNENRFLSSDPFIIDF